MRSSSSLAVSLVLMVVPLLAASACDDRSARPGAGPAERAGAQIDKAVATAKADLKESARDARSATATAGSAVERAGQKMQGK